MVIDSDGNMIDISEFFGKCVLVGEVEEVELVDEGVVWVVFDEVIM